MRPLTWLSAVALLLLAAPSTHATPTVTELARWRRHAQAVTITRDDWGIAHVHGRTDADAVFGMEYAQAEDDFARIEMNYLRALGRRAEADGDTAVFEDLRQRLFVDPMALRQQYAESPAWLRQLMTAFADGLNYYLFQHPEVQPRVIRHFEPWMALSFTEGSIGGDIEHVNLTELAAFYGDSTVQRPARRTGDGDDPLAEPSGSNGIAIGPGFSRSRHAILWINPHTSFYFRSELQMTSDEGLNAYGAVTWGQFFIYQGFNEHAGWMHTSSGVDNIDEYLETVTPTRTGWTHLHGGVRKPLRTRTVVIRSRTPEGLKPRTFTVYATPHGPVVRRVGGQWVSVSLMVKPVDALIQSYSRTKAHNLAEFTRIMERHANSSNNTLFADRTGNIAYLHSNYVPRRDTSFDWLQPVDGSDPHTDYQGLHAFAESPNVVNPASGFVYNCNNWPWTAAGTGSLQRTAFPRYMDTGIEESPRGQHALRVLGGRDWTADRVIGAAFDSWLPSFDRLLPPLFAAYDHAPAGDTLRVALAEPIAALRTWDHRWSTASVPTTLAIHWGEAMTRRVAPLALAQKITAQAYIAERAEPTELLRGLAAAVDTLTDLYGSWRAPWGDVNRFQRLDGAIESRFEDAQPSLPVPFASGIWGSLASFGARAYPGTRKRYGSSGNSFLAAVEFGDTLRAVAVTAGGESGHADSPHFTDQAQRYIDGRLREVYFYPRQLTGHTERVYHPGQ
ncbi:MAG: penicillin acylase family protein [Candidatus Eisenbacteria bacterium]